MSRLSHRDDDDSHGSPVVAERQPLLPHGDEIEVAQLQAGSKDASIQPGTMYHALRSEQHFLPKLSATMFNFFISGVALTAIGALIPNLEHFYEIKDGTIAWIFPCGVAGYLCSTALIQSVHLHLGRLGLAWLSPALRLLPATILAFGPPFPVALVAYLIFGFGTGLTDSGWCAWATGMPYSNVVQGFLHGSFGIGCVLGPFAAVRVIETGYEWFTLYRLIFLAVCMELIFQVWAFRHDTAAKYRAALEEQDDSEVTNPMKYKATWMCGIFYFVYIAIESTYSDWIVVYMRRVRHTENATAALASSIFWSGMSAGRVALGPVTEHFGLRRSVLVYVILSILVQVLFKLSSNVNLSLVLLGLNGVLLAPTFPSGLILLVSKIPSQSHIGAVAAAAALGQVGGATVPLGVGFMAERIGIDRLLDIVLALTAVLVVLWVAYCRLR